MNRRILLALLKTADLGVVALSLALALEARAGLTDLGDALHILHARIAVRNVLFLAAYLAVAHAILRLCGLYRSYRLSSAAQETRDLAAATLLFTVPLLVAAPLFGLRYASTTFVLAFCVFAFTVLVLERRFLRLLASLLRHYGRNLRNVLIVGTSDAALDLSSKLGARDELGYSVVGTVEVHDRTGAGNGAGAARKSAADTRVLQRIEAAIATEPVDEVFVAVPFDTCQPLIRRIITACEEQGVTVRVVAQLASLYWARARLDALGAQPVVTIYTGPPDTPRLLVKRAIDLAGATIGLLLCAPLFIAVAIAIKLDSPGPVFFTQERVGLNRRRFRAYKFRTMVAGAERMQAALEARNEAAGPAFKIRRDPRITRVGSWLRRLSIDELPQLANVWKGEMSLVGPRPLPVRDVRRIDVRWHNRRFSVKPGITCLWQVQSRQPCFDEWMELDMQYIDNWSLALDLKILAKTIPAVISGEGAY